MFLHSRRFSVWLVSFLAVLVIYFVYNRLSRTPAIVTSPGTTGRLIEASADACDSNGKGGKVGDIALTTARNVRYTKLNPQKQVEREFGFEELLHEDGNDWEIEKPYYTIYGKSFKSTITGEKARITVETSGGQVTPKEGMLSGNVTIRIWPRQKGDFSDAVIYLDDISFAGDKSLFSTDGMVEIDSNEVQLKGTGLEVILNGDDERLEYFKIARMKNLRIKRWSRGAALGLGASNKNKAGDEQKPGSKTRQEYKCVLDQNVVIETPQELLMAQVVSISDWTMSGGSRDEQRTEDGGRKTEEAASEVTISCDGGILVVPMEAAGGQKTEDGGRKTEDRGQKAEDRKDGKTTFFGREIDYNAGTGEAVATGPTRIIFDVNDTHQETEGGSALLTPGKPATVTITAQKQARFEPEAGHVAFEGDCRCTVSRTLPGAIGEYIVTAETLEVALKQKTATGDSAAAALDIERFVARGGEVRLASTKRAGERLLTGVEMKCSRMDYNTVSKDFAAAGPGLIKVDNSQTDEPQKGLGRFSLRRKCYAFLRNFESLQFDGQSNHLVADAEGGSMLVDYFPLNEGDKEDKVAVTASRVEADILETAEGRMELGAFAAKGAVTYEDKDVAVAGSEFVYDVNNAMINIRGDRYRPLLFNGAIFDSVQYDVKNDKWKTKIKGPGAIR